MAIGAVYLAQALLASFIDYAVARLTVRVRVKTLREMQDRVMRHLLGQALRFFHSSKSGELVSRLVNDTQNTSNGVGPAVQGFLQNLVLLVGYSLYLFGTSVWLTGGVMLVVCLHFGINRILREPVQRRVRQVQNAQAHVSAAFQEMFTSIRVIKSFGAEQMAFERTQAGTAEFSRVTLASGRVESISQPVRTALDALAVMAVLVVAALEVQRGELAAQGLVLYVYVARVVIQPANQVAASYLRLVGISAALTRVAELLNQAPQIVDGDQDKSTFDRELRLCEVSFAYDARRVIDGLSLQVRRGEVVAVVGRSGAGKSTLTDLILRLYDPTEGTLLIDGEDIRRLKQSSYRRLFGVVSQESLLLNDSVRNNIRFGRREISDAQIAEAARLAHAEGFISRLTDGYETVVGDRGVRLSGGERQRVAIARAIVHSPSILILDEATSSLDSESEREVQLAVDGILQRSTAIIIAHRLSTVLHADKIVFLDHGRIVDVGPHAELVDRCPPYRRLCELQFLHPVSPATDTV